MAKILDQWALDDLRKSGLDDATIENMGVYSISDADALKAAIGFASRDGQAIMQATQCYAIPYPQNNNGDGNGNSYTRVKLRNPMEGAKYLSRKGDDRKPFYYLSRDKKKLRVAQSIIITEGEKKAALLSQVLLENPDVSALGMPGVWMFDARDLSKLRGRTVYIGNDADYRTNPQVQLAIVSLALALLKTGSIPKMLSWAPERGKGIDDYLATVAPPARPGELQSLIDSAIDNPLVTLAASKVTVEQLASQAAKLKIKPDLAGAWYERYELKTVYNMSKTSFCNMVKGMIAANKGTAGASGKGGDDDRLTYVDFCKILSDLDYSFCRCEINDDVYVVSGKSSDKERERVDDFALSKIKSQVRDICVKQDSPWEPAALADAITRRAGETRWHPVREYLQGLQWDGRDRVSEFVACVKGDPMFPRFFRLWGSSAVRRIFEPGAQPIVLVLSGPQEIGKSTIVRWVCPLSKYFYAGPIQPDAKDCKMRVAAVWVWEIEELGSTTRRADVDALKAFITMPEVRERKPYGHCDTIKPPMASFIGTVNPNGGGYLVDTTGNRRFWTCSITAIDWSYQEIDRDQLWAQLIECWRSGEWRITNEDKAFRDIVNDEHMIVDPVEAILQAEFTNGEADDWVSLSEILAVLRDHGVTPSKSATMAIATTCASMGAIKGRRRVARGGGQVRGYTKLRRTTATEIESASAYD